MSVVGIRASYAGAAITMIGKPGPEDTAYFGQVFCRFEGGGGESWLPLSGLLWHQAIANPYEHLPEVTKND